MMFMMPMPPTSRLTAATAPSSAVSTWVVPDIVAAISLVSSTLKSSILSSVIRRRSRISSSMRALMSLVEASGLAATMIEFTSCVPVTRRCRVRSGMTTVSS